VTHRHEDEREADDLAEAVNLEILGDQAAEKKHGRDDAEDE